MVALLVTNSYYQLMMTLVLVWASFGLSWNVLSGYTGLVSFGHAAFFGIGAYTTALGQIHFDLSPWLLIPIAAVLGGIAGLLIGFPTFRLRGHYFALAMLAYPLALLYVFEWLGYQEVTLPMKRETPAAYMQFTDHRIYTLLALAHAGRSIVLITRMVEQSRFGMALLAIKQNEAAAEAAGIDTLTWKLRAITLSGAIAGAVGAFYAVVLLVVTPVSVFGMLVSAQALTVTLFGGVGTVWGPVIGAAILIPAAEILHAELGHVIPGIQGVIFGLAIVMLILVAPEGMFWKARDFAYRRWPRLVAPPPERDAHAGARRAAPSSRLRADRRSRDGSGSDADPRRCAACRRASAGSRPCRTSASTSPQRRDPRHHRPERRRQDHGLQPAQRLPAARCRADPARRPQRGRAQAAPALRGRRRPHLPDHAPVPRACRWPTTSWSAPTCAPTTDEEARRAGRRGHRAGRPDRVSPTASPAS